MKRHGLLGRDLVIRKTMLDECKGDRLEELLSSFALVVLKSTHQNYDEGSTLREAAASCNTEVQHRLPLILAHRHSLQEKLALRQELRRTAIVRRETMEKEHSCLKERRERVSRSPKGASIKDVKAAVDLFRSLFTAESDWLNIAMHGGISPIAATATETTENAAQAVEQAGEDLVLANLDHCLQRHNEELSRWQEFRRSLPPSIGVNEPSSIPKINSHPSILFDKHQTLETALDTGSGTPSPRREHEILPAYEEILQHMESELRPFRSNGANAEAEHANVLPAFRNESAGREPDKSIDLGDANGRSSADVTTPLASSSGNHLSCSVVHVDTTKTRVRPDKSPFSWLDETSERQSFATPPNPEAGKNSYDTETQNKIHRLPPGGHLPQDVQIDFGISPATDHTGHRLSTLQSSPLELSRETDALPVSEGPPSSLLERTRQSMSLAVAAAEQKTKRKKAISTRVSQFPVSQFETPERADHRETPLSTTSSDSTPREKLLGNDADYTSVFKTRPKVALSPSISPKRSSTLDSILEQQMEELDIEDDWGRN